jgi:ABC-type transport system involved in cytochrome bd biosynthesis fused ATPase/permease subunit
VSTRAATERVQQLAALAPAVTDPESPEPVPQSGRVGLHDVTAGWDGSEALAPVSLELSPGRAVGVVGPSGSGKSTLAALLVRFLAPVSGEQEVGSVPVERLRGDDVRRVVGLLDDDPYLFASSLVENVRLARPEADDLAVDLALRRAQLGPWLDTLPAGLHTPIGDGAASVSGGERARIGLARLLLADHPVLVLDEPTAHLDAGTATRVADDLLNLRGERSLVWITHGTVGLDQMDEVLQLA